MSFPTPTPHDAHLPSATAPLAATPPAEGEGRYGCDVIGCGSLADWGFIGEGGDLFLCVFHGGVGELEGWVRIEHDPPWWPFAEALRLPLIVEGLQRWVERHPRIFHALGGRVVSDGCDPNPFPYVSLWRTR